MIRNLFGGSTKCRTIDKLDIFGDGSGVALYRLDGNANDESGNYHGTETNVTYGGGVYERGAVFNGSNAYATTPLTLSALPSQFSFSLWFKINSSGSFQWLFGSYASGVGYFGLLKDELENTSLIMDATGATGVVLGTSLTQNTWHFATFVYDGTYLKGYLNGNYVNQVASTKFASTQLLTLGARSNDFSGKFNGSIDQVRIFNRAITAQEVATLYAECEPTSIVDNINPFEDGSLKALYKFDNDATDSTGVYNGTATNVTYASGKFGNCAVFNGSTSQITNAYTGSNDFTLSAWIKPDSVSPATWKQITGGVSATNPYSLFMAHTTNGVLQFQDSQNGSSINSTTNTLTTNGAWCHIVFTKVGTARKIYCNGIVVASDNLGVATILQPTGLSVGKYYGSTAQTFLGSIDQVRIFNKALTPLEVASLYNETTPMEEPMSVQVDPFKDGSGKALYRLDGNALDESGNYNGTPTSVTYGSGRFGRGAVFNGSSSWLQTLPLSAINYSSGFTFSCWVKTATNDSTLDAIVYQGNDGNVTEGFNIANYLGNVQFQVHQKSTTYNFPTSISNNTWRHIVLSIASSGYVAYVDGNIVGTITNASSVTKGSINPTPLNVGCHYGVNYRANYFNGSIDQVRIFNRALTQTEVTALYNEI